MKWYQRLCGALTGHDPRPVGSWPVQAWCSRCGARWVFRG